MFMLHWASTSEIMLGRESFHVEGTLNNLCSNENLIKRINETRFDFKKCLFPQCILELAVFYVH